MSDNDHNHDDHEIAGVVVKNNPIPLSAAVVLITIVLFALLIAWVPTQGF